jgi:predicted nucleic acid-binding protein
VVLLDANVLIYYLDESADYHKPTIRRLQELVDEQEQLTTSHHIIEEVLFVLSKYELKSNLKKAVLKISKIPSLILVEPSPSIAFSERYAALSDKLNMGVNDALLLQLMIDAGIDRLFSYDKKFANKARLLGIRQIA